MGWDTLKQYTGPFNCSYTFEFLEDSSEHTLATVAPGSVVPERLINSRCKYIVYGPLDFLFGPTQR